MASPTDRLTLVLNHLQVQQGREQQLPLPIQPPPPPALPAYHPPHFFYQDFNSIAAIGEQLNRGPPTFTNSYNFGARAAGEYPPRPIYHNPTAREDATGSRGLVYSTRETRARTAGRPRPVYYTGEARAEAGLGDLVSGYQSQTGVPSPDATMVGKKSGKALKREEGLERTDNNMKQSGWPEVAQINQKNYYTEFMKRDEQILASRLQNEANREKMIRIAKDKDRALARTGNTDVPTPMNIDGEEEEDNGGEDIDPTKIIVIHPGSQNLRIGLASDPLPKTIPMCIGYKWASTESDDYEARPKRQKLDCQPQEMFGEEFAEKFTKLTNDLKTDMRANKRKVLPNSKELVDNYNKRIIPEKIPEHNDPMRIEWTDVTTGTEFIGAEAQRIPDDSDPSFKVRWPIQHGVFHERDYYTDSNIFDDIDDLIGNALKQELKLTSGTWDQYSCVFVIPDLYDKRYVEEMLRVCLQSIEFRRVCFVQESLMATYGASFSNACVVDIGAQKTSIACVEDGMVLEESRVNLKYGGYDVTETFLKMMLFDQFPYQDINLMRRYDFLLAEELKIKFCTMNQAEIAVRGHNFHLRAPNQPTHKYEFKTYDEVILAPMGFFDPSYFDNSDKLKGRHTLVDRSYNPYDTDVPDDPTSTAQLAILTSIKPSVASTTTSFSLNGVGNGFADLSTPQKEKLNPFNHIARMDSHGNGDSRATSTAGSPAPEVPSTPAPIFAFGAGANGAKDSPGPPGSAVPSGTPIPPAGIFVDAQARTQKDLAIERDGVLPVAPLDTAIITSITHAVEKGIGSDKKIRDFFGGIMLIGGGAKTPGLGPFLEARLKAKRPDLADKILVGTQPREMDAQVVCWKGASIYAQMTTHESWIGHTEFDRLGHRILHHKVLWHY